MGSSNLIIEKSISNIILQEFFRISKLEIYFLIISCQEIQTNIYIWVKYCYYGRRWVCPGKWFFRIKLFGDAVFMRVGIFNFDPRGKVFERQDLYNL